MLSTFKRNECAESCQDKDPLIPMLDCPSNHDQCSLSRGIVRKMTRGLANGCALIRQSSARSFFSKSSNRSYYQDDLNDSYSSFSEAEDDSQELIDPQSSKAKVFIFDNVEPIENEMGHVDSTSRSDALLTCRTPVPSIPTNRRIRTKEPLDGVSRNEDRPRQGLDRSQSLKRITESDALAHDHSHPVRMNRPQRRGLDRSQSLRGFAENDQGNTLQRSCSFRIKKKQPCLTIKTDSNSNYHIELNIVFDDGVKEESLTSINYNHSNK